MRRNYDQHFDLEVHPVAAPLPLRLAAMFWCVLGLLFLGYFLACAIATTFCLIEVYPHWGDGLTWLMTDVIGFSETSALAHPFMLLTGLNCLAVIGLAVGVLLLTFAFRIWRGMAYRVVENALGSLVLGFVAFGIAVLLILLQWLILAAMTGGLALALIVPSVLAISNARSYREWQATLEAENVR